MTPTTFAYELTFHSENLVENIGEDLTLVFNRIPTSSEVGELLLSLQAGGPYSERMILTAITALRAHGIPESNNSITWKESAQLTGGWTVVRMLPIFNLPVSNIRSAQEKDVRACLDSLKRAFKGS